MATAKFSLRNVGATSRYIQGMPDPHAPPCTKRTVPRNVDLLSSPSMPRSSSSGIVVRPPSRPPDDEDDDDDDEGDGKYRSTYCMG
jgi:hypothetical protein